MQGSDLRSGAGLLFETAGLLPYFSFVGTSLFDVTDSLDHKWAPSYRRAPFQARPCLWPRATIWTSHLDIVVLAVLGDPLQAGVAVQQRAAAGGNVFL